MSERWSRLAPLTGVLVSVLILFGFIMSKTTPGGSSSGTKVLSWYAAHHAHQQVSDIVLALAAAFLVFFAATVSSYLRRQSGSDGPASLMVVGAALAAAGLIASFALDYAIADNYRHLSGSAAQSLNALDESFLPLPGLFVFYVASGVAILHSRALPAWLGVVMVVLGIATVTPAAVAGFFGLVLWPAVVGVMIYVRSGRAEGAVAVAEPAPA